MLRDALAGRFIRNARAPAYLYDRDSGVLNEIMQMQV